MQLQYALAEVLFYNFCCYDFAGDPNIWVVQTHSLLGYVKEVELNTKNIKPCKDTKYYQFECDGVKYFVLYEVFLNKELWASLGLEVPPV